MPTSSPLIKEAREIFATYVENEPVDNRSSFAEFCGRRAANIRRGECDEDEEIYLIVKALETRDTEIARLKALIAELREGIAKALPEFRRAAGQVIIRSNKTRGLNAADKLEALLAKIDTSASPTPRGEVE
ncbi:MAG: hypothetical protein AAFW97_13115 [Pseudomonadota bacterium]